MLKIIEDLVKEFLRFNQLPQPARDQDDEFLPFRMIGIGDGRQIFVSKRIDQLIKDFARQKMNESDSRKTSFTDHDFNQLVRRAFGPALAKIDLDDDPGTSAESVLNDVEVAIGKETDWISARGGREYAFGCTLFSYVDIAPFDIGPVRFEPRQIWLDRKASDGLWVRVGAGGRLQRFTQKIADGPVSKIMKRRIVGIWQGQKLKNRKPSADSHNEQGIIEATGACPYVCSVQTPGIGSKMGRDKALISARLALITIALIWGTPSKTLDGFNLSFDRESRVRAVLSFASDGLILAGRERSSMPYGPWIKRDQLEESLKNYVPIFEVAGEAINYLLGSSDAGRPRMMNTLVHALLWFHEGCREDTDLVAIVKFSAVMDVLSGGGKQDGIRKLISARLGITEDTKIHRDGLTMKEVIQRIYGKGRNRMIHGENKTLGHDWSDMRGIAEWLARRCLVTCMHLAAENPDSDDPKQFLK